VRIGILVLIGGVAMGYWSYSEADITSRSSENPETITLQQLIARGPNGNANVVLTDFVLCANCVFLHVDQSPSWMKLWIPVVPIEEVDPQDEFPPNPAAPRVLLFSDTVRNAQELESKLNKSRLQVRVTNSVLARDDMARARDLLQRSYPGIDLNNCLLLEQGRIPLSWNSIYLMAGMAALCILVGLALIVACVFEKKT
jgi:hypothetical protein